MKIVLRSLLAASLLFSLFLVVSSHDAAAEISGQQAAPLVLKIAKYEKKLTSQPEISIYVLESESAQKALSKYIGKKVGGAVIKKVEGGQSVPPYAPGIMIIGEDASRELAVNYAKSLKVLAIALDKKVLDAGVPIGIVEGEEEPRVLLNLKASSAFGLQWDPEIIKMAEIVKAK